MKLFHSTFLLAVLSTAVLVMASPRDPEASSDGDVVWQPASAWEYTGLFTGGNHGAPSNYDPVLLSLGRSVYADLQQARQAGIHAGGSE